MPGGIVGLTETCGIHRCMLQRMRVSHSIRTRTVVLMLTALLWAPTLPAQTPAPSTFTVLFRGAPIGDEAITVDRTAVGWTIASSGRIGPPFESVLRTLQLRYDADWKPLGLTLDATLRAEPAAMVTTVNGTTATIEVAGASPVASADTIDASAVLLPLPFIAPYEALAARLRTADAGATLSMYQPRGGSFLAEVGASSSEQIQTTAATIRARRTRLLFRTSATQTLALEVWGDERGRLLRVSMPAQSLEFVREDIAAVSTRLVTMSRPSDESVFIPANGFSLAGTVSRPSAAVGSMPVVILVGGTESADRDETAFGIPIFGQLAHALADRGHLVLRYDRRGTGQSGGRAESAALADFAEDAKAAVTFMRGRRDVDRRRIAVVGYGEGGWVAMLAAAKNDRVAAVGLIATAGVTGRELNLYHVTHGVERSNRTDAEKQSIIELQKQIQQAVVSGTGWDKVSVSPPIRQQADTPYFQSVLALDPSAVMKDLGQPMLIVEGAVDRYVPPANAEKLEALAKGRRKAAPVEVVRVPGINHLLVAAETGEVDEYPRLTDRTVSPAVTDALGSWLQKTLTAR